MSESDLRVTVYETAGLSDRPIEECNGMSNRLFAACSAVTFVLLVTPDAQAHVVHIEWKLTDTNLVVIAYFDNDLPADDADVTLYGSDDSIVATGKTDDNGTWKGLKPPPGNYRLTIKAMANHSQSITLDIAQPPKPVDPQTPAATAGGWVVATVVPLGLVLLGATVLAWRRTRKRTAGGQGVATS